MEKITFGCLLDLFSQESIKIDNRIERGTSKSIAKGKRFTSTSVKEAFTTSRHFQAGKQFSLTVRASFLPKNVSDKEEGREERSCRYFFSMLEILDYRRSVASHTNRHIMLSE